MVGAPAFQDAVRRAKDNPALRVGLHVVVIEGKAVLPPAEIPALVDSTGLFPSDQLRIGLKYYVRPEVRRQLAAEIRAQFAKFASTGLPLDHANAHKHMQLHPTIGRLIIDIGREFGLRAMRVPSEPPARRQPLGNRLLRRWCAILRRQARAAGLITNDHILGLSHTGHMTPAIVADLLGRLPEGLTELYFHPATRRDPDLIRLMPDYEHTKEWEALMNTPIPPMVELTTYSRIPTP